MSARVIITGAAGGLATAAIAELQSRGATVVGLDLHGDGDGIIECDVRDQESVDRAVAAGIERLGGGVDVLINNAGVGDPQSATAAPDEKALAVIDINLIGPWRVTSAAIDALRESRGRVVNIASGLAHVSSPFGTAYTMSKRGLVGYSNVLRLEHADRIKVTTIYPGYIRTDIHAASQALGMGLEGAVPAEPPSAAAKAFARAALDPNPPRDLATTRSGGFTYGLLRILPFPLVDRITRARARALARKGHFDDAELARPYREALKRGD